MAEVLRQFKINVLHQVLWYVLERHILPAPFLRGILVFNTNDKKLRLAGPVPVESIHKAHERKRELVRMKSWIKRHPLLCFGVAAAIWLYFLYWGVLSAPFVYDDLDQVANNPALQSWHLVYRRFLLEPVSFTSSFLGNGGFTYRPVFWMSLALDRHIWGADASGFHFTNLLLHWCNGVLLFQLLRRLKLRISVATGAAFVWMGLPILSESVAWVSARAYPLSICCMLVACLAALRYVRTRSPLTLFGFALAALLANFSHEQGMFLVLILALGFVLDIENQEPRRWAWLAAICLIADGLYAACKAAVGAHAGGGQGSLWAVGATFWKYVQLILFPVHMSIERSSTMPVNEPSSTAIVAWLAVLGVASTVFLLRKKNRPIAAGLGILLIGTLPYCGFVPIYQGMAERFVYLASMGLVIAGASAAMLLPTVPRRVVFGIGAIWIAWGAWRLSIRVQDWQQPIALYRHSLEATPRSAVLEENLGVVLRDAGDSDGALAAFQKAVELKPDYAGAIAAIADIHAAQGNRAQALDEYQRSLAIAPNDPKTLLNSAAALQQAGRTAEAEAQYRQVIALVPSDSAAYVDLESLYIQAGRHEDAIAMYKRAITVNPNAANAYFDLGVMFQELGQDDDALVFYKKVLQIKPGDPQTLLYISKLKNTGS
jgi:tetratricopeptide (TPR) repeat protein